MSRTTKDINKVTGTVISLAVRLIFYAVVLILLAEGCTKGYAFGYEIFCSTAMEAAPGRDRMVTIAHGTSDGEAAELLKKEKLIKSPLIFRIQKEFYDYEIQPGTYILNTSMTTKEILWILDQDTDAKVSIPLIDTEKDKADQSADTGILEKQPAEQSAVKPAGQSGNQDIEIMID